MQRDPLWEHVYASKTVEEDGRFLFHLSVEFDGGIVGANFLGTGDRFEKIVWNGLIRRLDEEIHAV